MFLVIEGMDNTGKTTLARKLEAALKGTYIKSLGHAPVEDQVKLMDAVLADSQDHLIICDRWPTISEEIYGPICRGKSIFSKDIDSQDARFEYHSMLWEADAVIIYCRPHRGKVFDTIDEREQMEGVQTHAAALLDAYDKKMAHLADQSLVVIAYDYETTSMDEIIARVKEEMKKYGKC